MRLYTKYDVRCASTSLTTVPSLCPLNASVPIEASGIIPVNAQDVSAIPPIALSIPDFEGEAILRLFANSTQTEIGCYSAVVTNGNSFSHPKSVGSVLGIFAFVAMIASFATAIYGEAIPTMRLHYAHSLSVGVVFAVFQHIFFTGALSVNWPSVLAAWWSNFAWAGGMIYSDSMQSSINSLIGNNIGNTSQVGAAAQSDTSATVGGGFDISSIYKRALGVAANHPFKRDMVSEIYQGDTSMLLPRDVVQRNVERSLHRRALTDASDGFRWYGQPVGPGLPLPGNYSGFAGTLGTQGIRASNAFMTGFLWFLILLVLLVAAVIAFKWALEGMARLKWIKQDKLRFFRDHWLDYTTATALRICFLAWFMMMFLTIFQFTYSSSGGVKGIAAIVFIIFLVGIPGLAALAIYYKKQVVDKRREVERKKLLGFIPWFGLKDAPVERSMDPSTPADKVSSKPFWRRMNSASTDEMTGPRENIHDNDDYTMKFGWLTARFRRTRWWFFAVWLAYEFLRAIFYGGASGYPLAQVFGLLIIEFAAFAFILWARPFEGRRLNLIVVYCLGFSKVTTVALSAAFDTQFNLERITTTVIGVVIIVIQGILTIITLIAIVVGAISSYMSISRNHENFRPKKWHGLREKYFDHLDRVVNDIPREPKASKKTKAERKAEAEAQAERDAANVGFEMRGIKRIGKIEDDEASISFSQRDPNASAVSLTERPQSANQDRSAFATPSRRTSRAPSAHSTTNLPFGARPHRASWSTRDFSPAGDDNETYYTPIDMNRNVEDDESVAVPAAAKGAHGRKRSKSNTTPSNVIRPMTSNSSLRIGGDVSGPDMIGKVPAPSSRPRSATYGSTRGSRGVTPTYGPGEAPRWGDYGGEDTQSGSQRNTRFPLTPAQEMDEWTSPKSSRET